MRRLLAAAFLLAAACLVAGCFGSGEVLLPTGAECRGETYEDAEVCEGQWCLQLVENEQGLSGVCSKPCYGDEDCTAHEGCEEPLGSGGRFCFRRCAEDTDCYDGFVCRLVNVGSTRRYCLVDPVL